MCPHLLRGGALSFFEPLKEPSYSCADREVFLDSGVVILSVYFNRAQLLLVAFIFGLSGGSRVSVLLCLTNTSCPAQGPILSPTSKQLTMLELGENS